VPSTSAESVLNRSNAAITLWRTDVIGKDAKALKDTKAEEDKLYNSLLERARFLNQLIKPGILEVVEAGWMLGFPPHSIRVLVGGGLLKPLGNPTQQSRKQFCIIQIEALRVNTEWKAKAVDYVRRHWQEKNWKAKGKRLTQMEHGEVGQ
jgi:hypothetical protein